MAAVASPGEWVTVRAFSGVAAEASVPLYSAAFADLLGRGQKVEVRLVPGGTTANSPSGVTFSIWRRDGVVSDANARIDRLATISAAVSSNALATTEPVLVEFWGRWLYVTASSFAGGTAPTFTGTIEARLLKE